MSILDIAMKKHIEYIVKVEGRPFYVLDFENFVVEGTPYHVGSGTFRNKISDLRKSNEVVFQFKSGYAYYSLPGYHFSGDKVITQDHAGLPITLTTPTYLLKWLAKKPAKMQALHDFRLTFPATGIWNQFFKIFPNLMDKTNKNITLETWKFMDEIDVTVTVHHTDSVSIAIACTSRPIAVDVPDLFYLIEILTTTQIKIEAYLGSENNNKSSVEIPRYTSWIVKMWHFGIDVTEEYDGEAFHITIRDGLSDLWRIYTKRMKDGKLHLRAEHQELLNKPFSDAILDKIFSEDFDN